jgi:hypothetical protein
VNPLESGAIKCDSHVTKRPQIVLIAEIGEGAGRALTGRWASVHRSGHLLAGA